LGGVNPARKRAEISKKGGDNREKGERLISSHGGKLKPISGRYKELEKEELGGRAAAI